MDGNATAFSADLSSVTGAQHLFDAVTASFGPIDILVNNAGIIIRHEAVEFPFEDWQKVMQVNLNAVFQLSQLAARSLIDASLPARLLTSRRCSPFRAASGFPHTLPPKEASPNSPKRSLTSGPPNKFR